MGTGASPTAPFALSQSQAPMPYPCVARAPSDHAGNNEEGLRICKGAAAACAHPCRTGGTGLTREADHARGAPP
eukprot:5264157-Alexandrium_andersonii.AAC.1